jgi:hypothetical protein
MSKQTIQDVELYHNELEELMRDDITREKLLESFTSAEMNVYDGKSFERIVYDERIKRAKSDFSGDLRKACDRFEESNKDEMDCVAFNSNVAYAWERANERICYPRGSHVPEYEQMYTEYKAGMTQVTQRVEQAAQEKLAEEQKPLIRFTFATPCPIEALTKSKKEAEKKKGQNRKKEEDQEDEIEAEEQEEEQEQVLPTNEQESERFYALVEKFEQLAQAEPDEDKQMFYAAWAIRYRREANMYKKIAQRTPNQPIQERATEPDLFDKPYDMPALKIQNPDGTITITEPVWSKPPEKTQSKPKQPKAIGDN